MYGDLTSYQEAWLKADRERVTADKAVIKKKCFLFSANLVASGAGAATAQLRDGENDGADILIDLAAPTSDKDFRFFNPPIPFKKGLFVDVGSNVTAVFVHWLKYEKEE